MKGKLLIITYVFLTLSVIFLLINSKYNTFKLLFWEISFFYIYIFFLIVGSFLATIFIIKYSHQNSENPIKGIEFTRDYFDKVGYSIFTSGIVSLVLADKFKVSVGLIFLGGIFILISEFNRTRYNRFVELSNSK